MDPSNGDPELHSLLVSNGYNNTTSYGKPNIITTFNDCEPGAGRGSEA